jgi:hypothetical protein
MLLHLPSDASLSNEQAKTSRPQHIILDTSEDSRIVEKFVTRVRETEREKKTFGHIEQVQIKNDDP